MKILAIDPGTEKSAWCVLDDGKLGSFGLNPNFVLVELLVRTDADRVVIEMIARYGMPVGKSTFETCVWIGRFQQASCVPAERMYRMDVKMHLCHDSRAKDGNIRQVIIDRYPATGGGKCPQVGTKKKPGPLYGVSKDVWSALALAITYNETQRSLTNGKETQKEE